MLAIQSPLRQNTLKHNIIERDKVIVPPHWDSWGKIRVLREGFDVEGISSGWSIDISLPDSAGAEYEVDGGALAIYEEYVKDYKAEDSGLAVLKNKGIEVPPVDTQEFLAQQLEVLEAKRAEDSKDPRGRNEMSPSRERDGSRSLEGERVREHVGPVQFNVGGIQVDADDMLKRLKVRFSPRSIDIYHRLTFLQDRDATRASEPEFAPSISAGEEGLETSKASAFFTALLNRPKSTPTKASKS